MPDTDTYLSSELDWDRLSRFAKRVARETQAPKVQPTHYVGHLVNVEQRTGLFRMRRTSYSNCVDEQLDPYEEQWLIATRYVLVEEGDLPHETWLHTMTWYLGPRGELNFHDEFVETHRTRAYTYFYDAKATLAPMTPENALELDHTMARNGRRRGKVVESGTGLKTGRIWAHSRGVGLSVALKKLLPN